MLLGSLDTTILNVALPAIRQDVNPSATRLQWRLDACTIALATLLTSAGSAADRLGRKRVFRPGLMPVHRRHLPLSHGPLHPARLLTSVGQEAGGVEAQAGACRL
ncbi:MFS transporter [Streptomyces flavotricini]|uniref:MFS transporter n=1 Tax=Streptomyces flavotricini TaxID=66888 RepID=A0ABS8EHD3_9ACTN|nr:MFS transporter [Streptomyces flavotricini]MCC0100427.1 MFS transporter [Streptomyces flavotricini]